ncbi:MAG: hypothetical protein B7Y86_02630 [Brevundimonas subvibrioides]|uniref:Rhodanese domain-containing protein n=1 Tax=Brevundimonas subvibrioides TaxID=74313 RepID=A0A258HNP8_9CAUL|nr:rhodanese family protein [Brevundimonas subvibrioides]OYX58601.1 MAG: hypothetical protein B7Y86_02630 [Brevundimonas subvibrioides]
MRYVSPETAQRLVRAGALLVDIRDADEHARERIPGAVLNPMSAWDDSEASPEQTLIFHCRSGSRTDMNIDRLAAKAGACDWYVVDGGVEAWRKAGLTTIRDRSQPIDLQRQVFIVAGGLVAVGVFLGILVSSWFLTLPMFVGLGLTLSGLTGFCGMARILALAPWNRHAPPLMTA